MSRESYLNRLQANCPRGLEEFFLDDVSLYVRLGNSMGEARDAFLEGQRLAERYADGLGGHTVEWLAGTLGVKVETGNWVVAEDSLMMPGECSWEPALIRVNQRVVQTLSEKCRARGIDAGQIRELVIAHELFHVITRRSGGRRVELAAHSFARTLLRLEFSPLLYERVLRYHMNVMAVAS